MDLQNGYKVVYEKAADGKRTFYASTDGLFAGADVIAEATIGEYKLVYEKDGRIYGSTTGVPAEDDYCFEAFDKVFKAETEGSSDEEDTTTEDVSTETTITTDDNEAGEEVEDTDTLTDGESSVTENSEEVAEEAE